MTDQTQPGRRRRATLAIIIALVLVVVAVAVTGLLTAGGATPAATATPNGPGAATSSAPVSTPTSKPSSRPSSTPTKKFTPTPAATAPTPHATKTATISAPAPIKKELTARVSKMEAVQGKASAPGEIAGPAVRFTITITNTTGKRFDLSTTVVNAYAGADSAPAVALQSPGAKPFPSSVANGASATGVFVFNIPKADRNRVQVTVDTSVLNPVVAFKGAAPRG
jgi:cytoskeletal protein RodZ